ncbi:hypothetical protein [Lactococcus lactis]|uniref:hypothetical protein n=1 Tax=Lactococcus lactis TaxID=1358 RepID=UPI00319E9CF3
MKKVKIEVMLQGYGDSHFATSVEEIIEVDDNAPIDDLWAKRIYVEEVTATDKLSVEKLQEHLLPYKKETVQKIIDEKMQLVTADEFLKLHKESLTAIRENDKLQEQLNTAKKALTEIAYGEYNTFKLSAVPIAKQALAAIGGDDE